MYLSVNILFKSVMLQLFAQMVQNAVLEVNIWVMCCVTKIPGSCQRCDHDTKISKSW